jgi:YebC/PmpR family DNA-binding regulatory protein
MSGHSKWANIKHRKGAQDAMRARQFTKAGREIIVAVRAGGPDVEANSRLRAAIAAARDVNMPKDRIEKAIAKGAGHGGAENYEEVVYEGHGPAGVAVFVNVLTDNRNRTTPELRFLFNKYGGDLSGPGAVAWMFERKGRLTIPSSGVSEEQLLEVVMDAGGDDVVLEEDHYEVYTSPETFSEVRDRLEKAGVAVSSAEVAMIPKNLTPVQGKKAESLLALLEALDNHDDVQKVAANCDILDAPAS